MAIVYLTVEDGWRESRNDLPDRRACIDGLDRACAEECLVGCPYARARALDIHPDERVDYGA
jgi:hypothetical protein